MLKIFRLQTAREQREKIKTTEKMVKVIWFAPDFWFSVVVGVGAVVGVVVCCCMSANSSILRFLVGLEQGTIGFLVQEIKVKVVRYVHIEVFLIKMIMLTESFQSKTRFLVFL